MKNFRKLNLKSLIELRLKHFIEQNMNESTDKLVLKIRQQLHIEPNLIINQINGRKKVGQKIPSWAKKDIIFPSVVSFEQCSSEFTARYKASLISGKKLIDLTGGFGVDTYFLSENFEQVQYFERDNDLLQIVRHNFQQLGVTNTNFRHGNGVELLKDIHQKADWIYLDPSRRDAQNTKIFLIEDCAPDILQINDFLLTKTKNILIKLSPMLDLDQILLKVKGIQSITIVSVKNECKELLLHVTSQPKDITNIPINCINITENQTENFTALAPNRKINHTNIQLSHPLTYIYEPNKSILKGNTQNYLAEKLDIYKLHIHSNFFTSKDEISTFPGRIFKTKDIIKLKKKQINKHLDDGKANIIARNFPLKASQIYDKFKIKPGGNTYLLATKLQNNDNVLIVCERVK